MAKPVRAFCNFLRWLNRKISDAFDVRIEIFLPGLGELVAADWYAGQYPAPVPPPPEPAGTVVFSLDASKEMEALPAVISLQIAEDAATNWGYLANPGPDGQMIAPLNVERGRGFVGDW